MNILVTGGAGFVGSHLVDRLVKEGHNVRVLDNLEYQVHGGKIPDYLNYSAEYIYADIRDKDSLKRSLEDIEIVFHQAAMVGVGQSMYQIDRYMDVNTMGTSHLLDLLVNEKHGVKKLIVASSMSIYGEGKYSCNNCGEVFPKNRSPDQFSKGDWEVKCESCGNAVKDCATDESKPLNSTSIYAISKKTQEEMCLTVGRAYGLPTVALRYFNIYGPRQALSNPYTGVCAIFSCRIKNDKPPLIFEDGQQSRDFISVHDIVDANILAMNSKRMNYGVYNVGTGVATSINDIARTLIKLYGKKDIEPTILGKFREGDIRHCYADISKIKKIGFKPKITFEEGMKSLVEWANDQNSCAIEDRFDLAHKELESKGLTK